MEQRTIFTLIRSRYISKVGKYVADIGFRDGPKQTIWITERQLDNLRHCFDETKEGYSDKDVSVIGHWENGFYRFATVLHHKQPKEFKEPYQHDLSDLKDVD